MNTGCQGSRFEPFGPHMTRVEAVSIFATGSQAGSQRVSGSARGVPFFVCDFNSRCSRAQYCGSTFSFADDVALLH